MTVQSILPRIQLIIRPQWRNDGHLTLEQQFSATSRDEADLIVQQETDMITSMGRSETHVSVCLQPKAVHSSIDSVKNTSTFASIPSHLDQHELIQPNGKVMLDDGTILPDSNKWHPPPEGMSRVDYNDGIAHIKTNAHYDDDNTQPMLTLTAQIPEKLNLTCEAHHGGSIDVDHKVEGDSRLTTTDGDIRVKKLRGHQVVLETNTLGSVIHASDLLEAEHLQVSAKGRFRAQRIQGDHVHVIVDQKVVEEDGSNHGTPATPTENLLDDNDNGAIIDISALYTSGEGGAKLSITSSNYVHQRLVSVKSNHGHIHVDVTATTSPDHKDLPVGPLVQLGGINGSCNVSIDIMDGEKIPGEELLAGRIHIDSLSPNSISVVTATHGNFVVTIDQNIKAELRLLSAVNATSMRVHVLSDDVSERTKGLLSLEPQQIAPSAKPRIHVGLKTFEESRLDENDTNLHGNYVEGWLHPKPPTRTRVGGGKIRLEAAASQALHDFDPARQGEQDFWPLLVVITNGNIDVEALSWKESIARKFGLDKSA